jgi:PAS domain S-box-containing protein
LGCDSAFCDRFEEACRQVLTTGRTNPFEFSYEGQEGITRSYHARVVPEFARDGSIESLLAIISDFTDRRNAEIAVAESERKLRRLVESNVIGVIIVEGELITSANDVFLKTFGYTREDLQAATLNWREMTPPEYRSLDDRALTELQEQGVSSTFEKEYWRKDGRRVPILIGAAALNSNGTEWVCFVVDLSKLKDAEAALKKTNFALLRSNEDLEQFAYAASHDLQEPLRTVSIYTELLARQVGSQLAPPSNKFLEIIRDAASRMLRLINDLLEFSHAQSAELSSGELIPAANMVNEAVKNLKNAIEESGAVVSFADLPAIAVDVAQFTPVFQNLIGNSIKYRKPDDPPRIEINAERRGEDWVFAVRDNGTGFEQAHAERIFGHFKRLHGRDIPGTGIGLAIVKKVIERHGGHVWAESEPGKGATFYFRLPVVADANR